MSAWPIAPTTRSAASRRACSSGSGSASPCSGDPELILLDEPTSALDPVGRKDVRAIVRAARDRGATVILNSHLLTEVERVCDRVVILHHGRAIASGTLDEVVAADGVRLRVTGLDDAGRGRARARSARSPVDGEWLTIRPLAAERVPDLVAAVVAAGGRVHAVDPGRGSLEARFLELLARAAGAGRRDRHRPADRPGARPPARRLGPGDRSPSCRWRWSAWGSSASSTSPATAATVELEIRIGVSQVLILIAFMFSFVLAMTAAFIGAPAIGGDLESGRRRGDPGPAAPSRRDPARPLARLRAWSSRLRGRVGPARDRGRPAGLRLRPARAAPGRRLPRRRRRSSC